MPQVVAVADDWFVVGVALVFGVEVEPDVVVAVGSSLAA